MGARLTAVLAGLALAGAAPAVAQEPTTPEPVEPVLTYWQENGCDAPTRGYRKALRRAYWFAHAGGNYRHADVTSKGRRRLAGLRACARSPKAREAMLKRTTKRKRRWRFHRRINLATPYGEWAIPGYVVGCESGGDYTEWNHGGSGASGAYQIMGGTWYAYGGGRYASAAAYARPWQQHLVARRILRGQGLGAWSCA